MEHQRATMHESEESSRSQLELARRQGEALAAAVAAMDEEADSGVTAREAGDYEVAVAVEEAEGLWQPRGGQLEWVNPEAENCHVEVCVRDRADGRFVPGLTVVVTLLAEDGRQVGTHEHPFLWHPWLYHYGRNWRVPGPGRYRARVRVEPPGFARHDHENGRRYADPVEVEFAEVDIAPGRKTV
ncbi:MAG: iron transporter [Thermoleophilia bacterium]